MPDMLPSEYIKLIFLILKFRTIYLGQRKCDESLFSDKVFRLYRWSPWLSIAWITIIARLLHSIRHHLTQDQFLMYEHFTAKNDFLAHTKSFKYKITFLIPEIFFSRKSSFKYTKKT